MAEIIFTNTLTYATGKDVLSPLITSLFDQDDVSNEYKQDVMSKLGFKATRALSPEQKFSVIIGAVELDEITEDQDIPEGEMGKGEDKGFEIKQYGKKFGISKLFRKRIEAAQSLDGADSSVKAERMRLAQNIMSLRRGQVKTKNIVMTSLLTGARSEANAYGPGSATPYGEPLASASHPYNSGADTFSNLGTTADGILSAANLQDHLDFHKSELRLQNGDFVDSPSVYKLIVSRKKATTAREILNSKGNRAAALSGTGTNSAEANQFDFDGNKVELVELPTLGFKKKDGSTLGTVDYRFTSNAEMASMASALRLITLYDAEVDVYHNHSNKKDYVSLDMGFAVDHYGLESFMTFSKGTES